MRISDWSSDVCSSDLRTAPRLIPTKAAAGEADLQARGLSFADATALKQAEKDGRIKVHLWPVGRGAQLALYPNLNAVAPGWRAALRDVRRSEEHTSELQSLMRISYAVFCLKKKKKKHKKKYIRK